MIKLTIKSIGFTSPAFEQTLVQTLAFQPSNRLIQELLILGFEYSSQIPISLNLESTRSYSYIAPILREKEYIRPEFTLRENDSFTKNFYISKNLSKIAFEKFFKMIHAYRELNAISSPLHLMANTGAKASWTQLRQLIGFRGYLANARGYLYNIPVMQNFSRGLKTYEYFISSYGARKGIVDTALKTADSGYLTRRLVENTQDLIIKEKYCGSQNSLRIEKNACPKGNISMPSFLFLWGKTLTKNIINIFNGNIIQAKEHMLVKNSIKQALICKISQINIASSILCLAGRTVCNSCFGFDTIDSTILGESIGVIAGESIGEPGTQKTLRTFHTGGVFTLNYITTQNKTKQVLNKTSIFPTLTKIFSTHLSYNINNKFSYIKTFVFNVGIWDTCIFKKNKYLYRYLDINNKKKYIYLNKKPYTNYTKQFSLSYTPIFISLSNYMPIHRKNIRNLYAKEIYTNNFIFEVLFKDAIQLLIKTTNQLWSLLSVNSILAYKKKYTHSTLFSKAGLFITLSPNLRAYKIKIQTKNIYSLPLKQYKNKKYSLPNLAIYTQIFSYFKLLSIIKSVNRHSFIRKKIYISSTGIYFSK